MMNRAAFFLFFLICSTAFADQINVVYSFIDGLGNSQAVKIVSFTPIYQTGSLGKQSVVGDEVFVTASQSSLTNTMLSGFGYRVKYFASASPPVVSLTFTNDFPSTLTNGMTVNATDYLGLKWFPVGAYAYNISPGSGVVFSTNAATVTVSSSALTNAYYTNTVGVALAGNQLALGTNGFGGGGGGVLFTNAPPASSYTNSSGLLVIGTNLPANVVTNSGIYSFASGSNTNYLIGSGYSASANVVYTLSAGTSPLFYTNTATKYSIVNKDSFAADGFDWVLVRSDNVPVLGLNGSPAQGSSHWFTATNGNITSFGTVFSNIISSYPIVSFQNAFSNNFVYVNPSTGNDGSALRGHTEFSYASLGVAVANGFVDDVFILSPGTYNYGASIQLKNGQKIIGSGMASTLMASNTFLYATSTNVIEGVGGDAFRIAVQSTNLTLDNCKFIGVQDGIFISSPFKNLTVYNSVFGSPWDAYADYSATGGYNDSITNSTGQFFNCAFICDTNFPGISGSSSVSEAMILGPSQTRFYNCTISARANESTFLAGAWASKQAMGTNGVTEFYNCIFNVVNSGSGASYSIYNEVGQVIKLYNCTYPTNSIYDPSNKVQVISVISANNTFTGQTNTFYNLVASGFIGNGNLLTNIPSTSIVGGMTTNIQLSLGTARTNTLYFTNGILMKVTNP